MHVLLPRLVITLLRAGLYGDLVGLSGAPAFRSTSLPAEWRAWDGRDISGRALPAAAIRNVTTEPAAAAFYAVTAAAGCAYNYGRNSSSTTAPSW